MILAYESLLEFALQLARAAQQEIMPLFLNCAAVLKPDGTEVTEADRQAECRIREMIQTHYPDHGILGEEYGEKPAAGSPYQWIIDPVDGTSSFVLGVPVFGTLIAVLENRHPVVGVIHMPAMSQTVYAAKGLGCWFESAGHDRQRIHAAAPVPLSSAMISASGTHATDVQPYPDRPGLKLSTLINMARRFRFCGDCLQHVLVCRGRIHAALDTIMQPWDSAAVIVCVEESGGIAATVDGGSEDITFGGSLLSACHPDLLDAVVACLKTRS